MLTIKYINYNASEVVDDKITHPGLMSELIFEAEHFEAILHNGGSKHGAKKIIGWQRGKDEALSQVQDYVAPGSYYVMNDAGKTIASYIIPDKK